MISIGVDVIIRKRWRQQSMKERNKKAAQQTIVARHSFVSIAPNSVFHFFSSIFSFVSSRFAISCVSGNAHVTTNVPFDFESNTLVRATTGRENEEQRANGRKTVFTQIYIAQIRIGANKVKSTVKKVEEEENNEKIMLSFISFAVFRSICVPFFSSSSFYSFVFFAFSVSLFDVIRAVDRAHDRPHLPQQFLFYFAFFLPFAYGIRSSFNFPFRLHDLCETFRFLHEKWRRGKIALVATVLFQAPMCK